MKNNVSDNDPFADLDGQEASGIDQLEALLQGKNLAAEDDEKSSGKVSSGEKFFADQSRKNVDESTDSEEEYEIDWLSFHTASVPEIAAAFGLEEAINAAPDFWVSGVEMDGILAQENGVENEATESEEDEEEIVEVDILPLGKNAPAALSPRVGDTNRMALPSGEGWIPARGGRVRKQRNHFLEAEDDLIVQAVQMLAHPKTKENTGQRLMAARVLLKYWKDKIQGPLDLPVMVNAWWKAARQFVDICEVRESEWNRNDGERRSPNVFYAKAVREAAASFITAMNCDDETAKKEMAKMGFPFPPPAAQNTPFPSLDKMQSN